MKNTPNWKFKFKDDLPAGVTLKQFSNQDKNCVEKESQLWSINGINILPNGLHRLKN